MVRFVSFSLLAIVLLGSAPVFGQGSSVGFVNVQKVIFEYKKTQEITKTFENRIRLERNLIRQKREALRAKLEALREQESEAIERNAALLERAKKQKEIALDEVEIELHEKNTLIQLEQDLVQHMKKVYREVRRESEAIARERGLKMVLMISDDKIGGRTREEVSSEILVRPVLWFDPSLDLTSELLQRLNN